MKGLILILAQLVAGWPVLGQAPGSDAAQVLLAAPPPAPVVSANAQTVGNRGSRVFFYWVVANFPVGKSVPYGPAQVSNVADTLTGGNYVRVVWSPVTGATSYDVLRTTTAVLPNGAANIGVATAVSGTLYDNTGETINSYTVSSASAASGFWRLDNRNYSIPVMTFSSSFIIPTYIGTSLPATCVTGQEFFKTDVAAGSNKYLCTSANTWTPITGGGGGTPGGSNGQIQYNNAGAFGGAAQAYWDATNNRLGLGTASPSATLSVGSNAFTVTSAGAIVGSEMQVTGGPLLSVAGLGSGGTGAVYGSGNPAVVLKYGGSGGTIAYALGNTGSTGIGPSNTSPTGTLHIKDATASTGVTDTRFVAGAAQATVPTPISRWYANNGTTVLASMGHTGIFTSSNLKQGSGSPEGAVSGVVGDIYQNTTGGTGTSAYIKESGVGTTGWVAIAPGSGGSGLFQTLINDLRPTITTTTLTLDAGRCWGANKVAATAVITAGAGNGSFVAYCTDTQTLVVEDATAAGLTITCTNCTRIQTATPQVPEGLYPVATGTITTGQWTAVTDTRDFTTRFRFQNGAGMATTVVGSVVTEAVDPVQVQMTANDYDVVTRLDATASTSSAPAKTGTSLPGTCIVGDQYFKSDEPAGSNLYGCTIGNTWTKVGSGAPTITADLYWPFGYPAQNETTLNPGANVQRAYKFTPLANYSFSKIRYKTSGTGYVAFAVVTSNGNTIVTNSNATCNNATPGAGIGYECALAGTVSLTAGTSYYFVFTGDASTGIYVTNNVAGDIGWAGGTGFGTYFGQAANSSTGSAGTLAVAVPLGTISPVTAAISGNQPPAIVYVP